MDERERAADVERFSAGDADALQRLLVHYHPILRTVVERAVGGELRSRIEPDDVLQQAYVAAFKAIRSPASADAGVPDAGVPDAPDGQTRPSVPPRCTLRFDSPGGFYRWLEAITLARLKDAERALRRQKRDVAREVREPSTHTGSYPHLVDRCAATQSTPSRHVARAEAVAAVMSSLARLSHEQRDVICLRFLEGRAVAEVAQRLGKSEAAIHMLCHRALKALREHVGAITQYLTRL